LGVAVVADGSVAVKVRDVFMADMERELASERLGTQATFSDGPPVAFSDGPPVAFSDGPAGAL
jgi:hypothetical protein